MKTKNKARETGSARSEAKTKIADGVYRMDPDSFSFGPGWEVYPHGRGKILRRVGGRS